MPGSAPRSEADDTSLVQVSKALGAQQTIPFELRPDTILDTGLGNEEVPGITPFTADVTTSGSATVSLPLWAPRGRAGIQPSLSIVYDSQGSDGLLGPGFNLAGLSQIDLCPNSFARDGKLQAIDFFPGGGLDVVDRYSPAYCLDGARLAGADHLALKTEQDTYSSIRVVARDGVEPATFEVRGRDGLIRTYGRVSMGPGSQRDDALIRGKYERFDQGPGGSIQVGWTEPVSIAWALAAVEDRFGNRMDVFYEQAALGAASGAWHRPMRITYTQFRNASGSIEPGQREVTFHYELRPDVFTGYLAGVKVGRDFRLSRVDMKAPGLAPGASNLSTVLLRSYKLKYRMGSISKRSLLTEFQECDGKDICKTPVRFDWEQGSWDFQYSQAQNVSDAAAGAGLNAFGLGAGRQGLAYFVRSDKMNEGDGIWGDPASGMTTDFKVQLWQDTMRLLQFPDAESPSLVTSDVTGGSIWYPYFNIEGTIWLDDLWDFFFGGRDPGDFCGKRHERNLYPIVTDWDGFGRSTVTPLSCEWSRSDFGEYPAPKYGHARAGDPEMQISGSEPNSQYWVDVDGDARNERVWMGQHEIDLTGDSDSIVPGKRRVVVNKTARGRTTERSPVGYFQQSSTGMRVVDLDGSGKMSLLGKGPGESAFLDALVYREKATSTSDVAALKSIKTTIRAVPELPPGSGVIFNSFHLVDINGDGLQDAVTLHQMGPLSEPLKLRVQLNTGAGFTEIHETSVNGDFASRLYFAKTEHGDFDGDGRVDIAIFRPGSPIRLLLAGTQGEFNRYEDLSLPSGDNKEWAQVIDTNNDGLLDFTYRQGNELRVARRIKATDVLKKVHGNIQVASYQGYSGLSYSFEYAPLSQSNPHGAITPSEPFYAKSYTETPAKPWLRLAPETMRVVSRLALNSNEQRVQSWRHLYRDGLSDTRGLGWLGFGQRVVIDEVTGTRTTTTYDNRTTLEGSNRHAKAPLAHLPKEETVDVPTDANTRIQTQRQWFYTRTPEAHASTYQQYASRIVETVREIKNGSATVVSESETRTSLDSYGTPLSQTTLIHGAATTDQVKTVTVPTFNTTTWLPQGTWTVTTSWMSCARAPVVGCTGQPDAGNVRMQQVTYDSHGQVESAENEPSLVGEAVTPTTSETYLKTRFIRNTKGLVEHVSQQGSGVTRTESVTYDSLDQTQLSTTTDAEGATWRYLFHPGLGVLAQTADPNDVHVRFQYDGFGRQRIVTPMYQGPSVAPANKSIVETHYEWNGTLPQHRTQVATSAYVKDETITRFDAMGRQVTTQSARFDGQTVTSTVTYDVLGRVVKREMPRTSSEQATWEGYEYDALNRVAARRFGDGTTGLTGKLIESFSYSAPAPYSSQAMATDALGQVKKTLVDFRGLMTQATEAVGTSKEATMTYSYGPFGRLDFMVDPAGNRNSLFYDTKGRLEHTVDPNAGTRFFLYNAFGELKSQSDAAAGAAGRITTTHQRDLLGRVLSSTNQKESLEYVYDNGPGAMRRLTRATRTPVGNPSGVVITDYIFDSFGRETDLAQRVGGETLVMSRQYDDYGRMRRLTYPVAINGALFSINRSYEDRGDLSSIYRSNSITNYWRAYEQDSMGRLKTAHYGNGVARVFRYDTQGRLRFTEARRGGNNVQRLAYEYTENDNLSARHDLELGVTQKYTYDALDRLERWKVQQNCQNLDVQFQYDKLGNMLSRTPVAGSEPSATLDYTSGTTGGPHAVKQAQLGAESFTYEYDHRGNQIASRNAQGALVRATQYTSFNLPESVTSSSGTVRFDYDASGTRVRKRSADDLEETVYLGGLYQRRRKGLTTTHILSIPSPEGVIAEVSWDDGSSTESTRYFLNDPQGSPDTVTDASGTVLERIKYEPFGARRQANNLAQAFTLGHAGARRGFTGHEHDDELGLINMRGRVYDPRLMKFLSVDPVIAQPGSAQAHNAYSYVLNNPTRYTDPSGFSPYVGGLVSRWDGGWTGAPQAAQSMMMSALDRHMSAPGPSLYLPSVDFKVPSVESLDDAKTQPDAHHTNDIGQSSGSSKSALTSLLTKASETFNESSEMIPCGPHLGCHASKAIAGSQLDSMLNASAVYDRYSPVSKLAAGSLAINEFIPFVTAGESVLEAKSACGSGAVGGCIIGTGKAAFYTLASGASILSAFETGGGVVSSLRSTSGAVAKAMKSAKGLSLNSSNLAMGVERASPKLISSIRQQGRTVAFATPGSEELRYLDYIGAEANVGGPDLTHILLRENPSKAAVLEEFLHGTQWRLGIIERLGVQRAETHVKSFMIRHQGMLGLSGPDVAALRQLMEAGL
ncbi:MULTISPECIES: RHS repeat-associated core domain-containing protein [unclassified Myxococcus]|uniref:RHS repeat-associated core domain-containing protein n=1 Tax=unclassified Myxococcus TaxID=2648731 RepID=UPI00157B7AAF|nr:MULTISPECIES: RHS repeat-associated core domain-containing protein [unclassified Myxococcus]NTX34167.1 VCBS repeat-containing protein [Myxococcus sp. CA033]NTX53119.1 VCBS repeat-containing protein [Myxococcus sp. CA039A]